jgi:hypothetical protein
MAVQYAFSQITTQGLRLAVDAADPLSYPGSGTVLTDVSGNGFTGNVSSSISFAVTNRGALFSPNSSSAITFTGSAANFGTGSFTMEMAFTPQTINGQHFLYSKNSGSFPNFGAFLTGSNGSGRLVAFYNISSTISCSASTPTGSFVTGSNYIVDVTYVPSQLVTIIYTNSNLVTQSLANGTGTLSTSASLFLLNNSTSSNVGSVANLYNFKVYNPNLSNPFIRKNYNAQAARFGLPLATYIPPVPLLLDTYSGAAAAYSLRLLNTSYVGFAIRVRRSSDNTEANIGFNVNGELDTIALLTFCGAGDGFVKTWYDQSGNARNATQTTAINQPQIVSSGSVILQNGKSVITFNGTSSNLNISNFAYSKIYFFGVLSSNATSTSRILDAKGGSFATVDNGGVQIGISSVNINANTLVLSNRISLLSVNSGTDNVFRGSSKLCLLNHYYTGNTAAVLIDGIEYNSVSGTSALIESNSISSIKIGCRVGDLNFHSGNFGEIIIYNSDESSNRTDISDNINDFYSIY